MTIDQPYREAKPGYGGFQLEFVNVSWVINHMTCYNSSASLVEITAFRFVKDFFKLDFPPMRALEIITGHVIYNPAYTLKLQLKTT